MSEESDFLQVGGLAQVFGQSAGGDSGGEGFALAAGSALQKVGGQYATAISVQQPRNLAQVAKDLITEAKLAGESFFYGWGSGSDRIEGPSVQLAMAAVRNWGNAAIESGAIQDLPDAWVIPMAFVDLEKGVTVVRPFRQSKRWIVHGRHDAQRKDDIRFQIGTSKATRNVILSVVPRWMVSQAIYAAKSGVRDKVELYIKARGKAAAIALCIQSLAKHGVTEAAILAKFSKATTDGLTVDDIVLMRGDMYALDEGQDNAETLYPAMRENPGFSEPIDPLEGETERSELEQAVASRFGGKPAESKPADSEPADSEPADSEPADSEPAEDEPDWFQLFQGTMPRTDALPAAWDTWCAECIGSLEGESVDMGRIVPPDFPAAFISTITRKRTTATVMAYLAEADAAGDLQGLWYDWARLLVAYRCHQIDAAQS